MAAHIWTRKVGPAAVALCTGVLCAGCLSTYGTSRTQQAASEREDTLILREQLRRLDGRLETVELQQDQVRSDMDVTRRETSRAVESDVYAVERRLDDLERRLDQIDASRERDKQEIIDTLTGTISKLMKQAPAPVASSNRRATSGYGYEHTVEPGQTLSAIAQAYGVPTKAIIDANEMTDPNQLRVGQTLFIPE